MSLRRYRRGLSSLTVLALFGTVNFIFALTKTSFYLVFSPFLPLFGYELGRAFATATGLPFSQRSVTRATGVTEMRLFTMGIPNSRSMVQPVSTSFSALRQILS